MIKFKEIEFSYGDEKFIENFNLNLTPGKIYGLLGKNGSGKTTLMKLLLGIEKIISGKIYFQGKNQEENLNYFRKNIGYVFQNPEDQLVAEDVEDELAFNMENYGYSWEVIRERIIELMEKFSLDGQRKISELSGGEKQRVAIASALTLKPSLLILDEGTSMSDKKNRNKIIELCKKIKEQGKMVIIITHDLEELNFIDEIIYLKNGAIEFFGEKQEFIGKILRDEFQEPMELPSIFKMAKELYRKRNIDLSEIIFSSEKVCDEFWKFY
ncbi:energy-coupling factor ABC transporter ATP-binding protein [Cetobacterium sp. SF1]|uniref:energy-coupling factor ABC transporter ATP-binding protein n=1 Tax=Cetobacterium sp. SF1 TaxID=3417654 RepID=UPI003CED0AD2